MEHQTIDPQRQQKAKAYSRIRNRLTLGGFLLDGLFAVVWLFAGWASGLRDWLASYTQSEWLLVAGFILAFGGLDLFIHLPLSYYSGFALPHQYELSNQTLKGWVTDQIKGALVLGPIGIFAVEVIYFFLRTYPEAWWLWAGGFLVVFNVLLTNLAPILLFPIFFKFTPLAEEHKDLVQRLTSLAERANTRVRGVYQFDMSRRTKAANAAITGIGNSRRIILGDTLLNEFSTDEIETVFAHEMGHQVHKDIPLGILVSSGMTFLGLYLAAVVFANTLDSFGFRGVGDIANLPLFGLVLGGYGLVTMPLENAWSRWREAKADQYAVETTRNGTAYASALTRLANQNLADVNPERWMVWLLYSHPPLQQRISAARENASKTS